MNFFKYVMDLRIFCLAREIETFGIVVWTNSYDLVGASVCLGNQGLVRSINNALVYE